MRDTWHKDSVGNLFYVKGRIGWRGLRRADFTEDGPYLITGMHIRDGQVNWDECFHIPERKLLESPEIIVQPGDMVVTKDGTIGKIAFIDSLPGPASLNSHLFLVRPKVKHIYARYAYHVLNSRLFMDFIERQRTGSTLSGLPENLFVRFEISYPDIDEQRAIAGILDTLDETIRQTDALVAKLKRIKAGRLYDLLTRGLDESGNLRDPIIHLEQFKDSILGLIPREWSVVQLSEIVPHAEYGISTALDDELGIPVLRMQNLVDGEVDLTELKYSNSPEAQKLILQDKDVLFNRTNSMEHVGRTGIWRSQIERATFASYLVRLVPNKTKIIPEYLTLWLNWSETQSLIRKYATPAVQQVNINPTNLRKVHLALPSTTCEQERIVAAITADSTSIKREETCAIKLRRVKQGLMDDLLTGRVRAADVRLDELMVRE